MMHSAVRPYLMDLGSANGTYLNNERIEGERYYELLERVSQFAVQGSSACKEGHQGHMTCLPN